MATRHDITLDQGSTFSILYELQSSDGTALDLTGKTFRSQARTEHAAASASFEFTSSVLTPASGQFYMTVPADQTANIEPRCYVYDVEMVSGSVVVRLVEGNLEVTPEVTK